MAKSQRRYTPEFRRRMVELHRAGRSHDELAKQYGSTSWSIRHWVNQADRDVSKGEGGLSTDGCPRRRPPQPRQARQVSRLSARPRGQASAPGESPSTATRTPDCPLPNYSRSMKESEGMT